MMLNNLVGILQTLYHQYLSSGGATKRLLYVHSIVK
jgi:hypothetical protein